MAPLVVHHLQVSQSERITWLCEELGIDYELKLYQRAPLAAPPEYKALHPQATAPIIQDGELTLAESAACVEYIAHKYGNGKLFVSPSASNYADFLYWYHFANGTLQPGFSRGNMVRLAGADESNQIIKMFLDKNKTSLQMADKQLKDNDYLAGDQLTAADIMSFWCFTTSRYWYSYSLEDYPNIQKYVKRISEREAYRRAMKKGDPDMELALGVDAPTPFIQWKETVAKMKK